MKVLILPVKETPEKDFNRLCMALRRDGASDLATFFCQKASWAEVTKDDPYVEIRMEQKQ